MTEPTPASTSQTDDGPPRAERGATTRGQRTRERLLDAAERLWGERGVEGVSLREIRLAAGERHNSVIQFHFGDRDGLLAALAQRHMPRQAALTEQLHARFVAEGRHTELAALVEMMVRPRAEYLRRGPSERAWTKIAAEQAGRPDVTVDDYLNHVPAIALQACAALRDQLTQTMSPTIANERLMSVMSACGHLCAVRARAEDAPANPQSPRPVLPFDTWLTNLLDMAKAALLAPHHP